MEQRTTIEIKVQKFVLTYGVETLIAWIDSFEKIVSSHDYPLFRKLEKETCRACDISLSDMYIFSTTPCTNARRIISFIAFHRLNLKIPCIAILLSQSERTISHYIKDSEEWITSPKSNKLFTDAYNTVLQNFIIE